MTKLLVSVRSAAEAQRAIRGGADLIDVKEPLRGSLGATDASVIHDVAQALAGRRPMSAALGELRQVHHDRITALPSELQFAKLGLDGCDQISDWPQKWAAALDAFPDEIAPVAVVYADAATCGSPAMRSVLKVGAELGCAAALVDTCHKDNGGLLDSWTLQQVSEFLELAQDCNLLTVLAGSLNTASIARLLPLRPDYIAVRGAACPGARTGEVDEQRVAQLAALVHGPRLATPSRS